MTVRRAAILGGALTACAVVAPPPPPSASSNTCSSPSACNLYAQSPNPICSGGFCQVLAEPTDLLAVIQLPQDSFYAPGATFAVPLATLQQSPCCASQSSCQAPLGCAQLPQVVAAPGNLLCLPSDQVLANWNLGNAGQETALPATATFRALWPPDATSGADATAYGLPLGPVTAQNALNEGAGAPRGPGGGPSLEFTYSLPPLVYEMTLLPVAPFAQAYPPYVDRVDLSTSLSVVYDGFDTTMMEPDAPTSHPNIPLFDLSRADGQPLDGWTAFLRDQTTLRPISNVVALAGLAQRVLLPTKHHPQSGDALENAALALTPPSGVPMPAWIFAPIGKVMSSTESYPQLPPPVALTGSVRSKAGGDRVAADLVFEATAVCRYAAGSPTPALDALSANHDFSFTAYVTAPDGTFAMTLPRGAYRLTIVPHGGDAELTVTDSYSLVDPNDCGAVPVPPIPPVDTLRTVTGSALVADGRPLAGAAVDLVGTGCTDGSTSPSCIPRGAQTTTADDGAYTLAVDPGVYTLRVRPAVGSHLPWIVQPLIVLAAPSATKAPLVTVPAPLSVGLLLHDPGGNPVAAAVVRMFETPAGGQPPLEVGEAVTDATGHYDLDVVPTAPQ